MGIEFFQVEKSCSKKKNREITEGKKTQTNAEKNTKKTQNLSKSKNAKVKKKRTVFPCEDVTANPKSQEAENEFNAKQLKKKSKKKGKIAKFPNFGA